MGEGTGSKVLSSKVLLPVLWIIWGSAFIGIKIGLAHATPAMFAALRVTAAVIALAVVLLLGAATRELVHPRAGLHRWALLLGLVQVAGFLSFQSIGMVEAGAGLGAVLLYTQPLLVAVGARIALAERLTKRKMAGLFCGWAGVVLLVSGELEIGGTPAGSMALLLLSAVCWACGTIIVKAIPTAIPLPRLLFWQNVYGLLPLWVVAAIRGGAVEWGWPLAIALLWVGVLGAVGGFLIQYTLVRRGAVGVVSSWIFPVPLIAAALGLLVLGERFHWGLVVGAAGVAFGIYLVNTSRNASMTPA